LIVILIGLANAFQLVITFLCVFLFFPAYCLVTAADIPSGVTAWIEKDNEFGPTGGDKIVKSGSRLKPNDVVQIGYCRQW